MTAAERDAWLNKLDAWQDKLGKVQDAMEALSGEAADLLGECPVAIGDMAPRMQSWCDETEHDLIALGVSADRVRAILEEAKVEVNNE